MVGTLRCVETNAKGCAGGVRAELFDGTDSVMLVWLGQRRIAGIESGRTLRVHGRLGKLGERLEGHLQPPLRDPEVNDPEKGITDEVALDPAEASR